MLRMEVACLMAVLFLSKVYFSAKREKTALSTVYAIFINNLAIDENGEVLNAKYAEQRAAQYIKQWCVKDYIAEPTFDGSEEVELY